MRTGEQVAERYRLDARLGRGGMGEVWRAYDVALGRPVAVKLLVEVDAEQESLRRFRREASIGARLQHPGITVVHDVGHHDGRLFIVMELLEGTDLAHLLARSPRGLPLSEALDLAVQAAQALTAAHDRKVVHRDLKPGNLFLLADGRLKICDFGIARTAEATEGLTATGRVFGSPPYMAPEQWRGEHVGTACDLYALGCVLFALLTGGPPFASNGHPWALMRQHVEDVPPPLRSVRDGIPADVEALVAELLAKDPAARPDAVTTVRRLRESGTAAEGPTRTVADPAPGPADRPTASPTPAARTTASPTPAARTRTATGPGAGAPGAGGLRRRSLVVGGVAALAAATGGTLLAVRLADGGGPQVDESFTLGGFTDAAYAVAFSHDSRTVAGCGGGDSVMLWNVATGSRTGGTLTGSGGGHDPVYTVAYSPDGKTLAEAGWNGDVLLWDTARGTAPTSLASPRAVPCHGIDYSSDGRTLAAGLDDGTILLWDVALKDLSTTLGGVHKDPVMSVAFSPDGKSLASIDAVGTVVRWNIPTQSPLTLVRGAAGVPAKAASVAFSPDGTILARAYGTVRLWTGASADDATVLTSRSGPVYALAFSPDGKALATGGQDGTVELWDVAKGSVATTLTGHTGLVRSVAFSPDGRTLAAASADRTVRLWKLPPPDAA